MAQYRQNNALIDELVTQITSYSQTASRIVPLNSSTFANARYQQGPQKYSVLRESASKTLRHHNHARTNQFDVQSALEGLEEKFRVYNKDAHADALKERLNELIPLSTKWTPEVLKLLLELSDRPIEKTSLTVLQKPQYEETVAKPLRWEDLARHDPNLRDKHIWENVDFADDTSDEEAWSLGTTTEDTDATNDTTISADDEGHVTDLGRLALTPDVSGLSVLRAAQFWNQDLSKPDDRFALFPERTVVISELQTIREVLFLLAGLPTTLFMEQSDSTDGRVKVRFALTHLTANSFQSVLEDCAKDAQFVSTIRLWLKEKQKDILSQGFQAELQKRIDAFDQLLSLLQQRYVIAEVDVVVSLLGIRVELAPMLQSLEALAELLEIYVGEPYAHAFFCLELLHRRACVSQAIGDLPQYEFMSRLFLDCFQFYLRPIRMWMEHGDLVEEEKVFFIAETKAGLKPYEVWEERYRLRRTSKGVLHAPGFLHTATKKIFDTGKNINMLKQLGKQDLLNSHTVGEPSLDYEHVCQTELGSLLSFSDMFDAAFKAWVQAKHYSLSSVLMETLLVDRDVSGYCDALAVVYLMRDGFRSGLLNEAIFRRISDGPLVWSDQYVLTDVAQSTVGSLLAWPQRLRVSLDRASFDEAQPSKNKKSIAALASITLTLSMPWPVQVVIKPETIPQYRRIHLFLLQIRLAQHELQSIRVSADVANAKCSADERVMFYKVRSRLLWFNTTIYTYLTERVVQHGLAKLHEEFGRATGIDDLIEAHRLHISQLVSKCLLSTRLVPLHKVVLTILDLSLHLRQTFDAQNPTSQPSSTRTFSTTTSRQLLQQDNNGIKSGVPDVRPEIPFGNMLESLLACFQQQCRFLTVGLSNVARAANEPDWEVLAQSLTWETGN